MTYAIILAGGVGSRFWPLSRESLPKQFLGIIGKESFLKAALRRIQGVIPPKRIFIVTNRSYSRQIRKEVKGFRVPPSNIILEPKPLNTLPAIGLCARMISIRDKQANLLVLPADHYIRDNAGFKRAIFKALKLSSAGFMCLVGVKPDSPCVGYGYIKAARRIDKDIFSVAYLKEKPGLKTARRLFKEKNIFWNTGIFCFKAEVILRQIKDRLPGLHNQLSRVKYKQDIGDIWPKIKAVSIDYGLLEKSQGLVMVKAGFDWSDLGSWDALCGVLASGNKKNVILSDCVSLDNANIFVSSYGCRRLIAAIGLRDTIIVDTPDALLICKKENAQDIKALVEILKRKKKSCV
ncbi:MAG: hypothetical protein FJZ11_00290 [Candidatus Omnitrophica bacterium]|nr:hypothetical protein [Candidatus Omnitrophota bacterium]